MKAIFNFIIPLLRHFIILGREIAKHMSPFWIVESYFVSAIGTHLLRSVGFSNDDNDAGCISKL